MYCERRTYNNVHICVLNKEYTTMFIYVLWTENIKECTYKYCEQRIYNNVHICVLNKEYTTMYISELWTENIQQCTYVYCELRIYNNVHICVLNKEYTTMYMYVFENRKYTTMHICVLWTIDIQPCTYMCSKQRIYNNVHIWIVSREYTTMYIYVF